jgi:predicted enzyme related to lactoylglutathione lyase
MSSRFIWYELLTTDADAASAFYSNLVGWKIQDSGMPGMDYRALHAGGSMVGGLMTLPADAVASGMKPGWLGYISVPDVDKAIGEITAAGGRGLMPGTDIPDVGRFAMLADPQGALFYAMTPASGGESTAFSPETIGHIGWNELHAADGPAAFAFYCGHFGWGKRDEHDMGPMGKYMLFEAGGVEAGGIMTKHSPAPPHWLFYFNVDDITAGAARVSAGGGAVVNGPHQVPGGQWIIQCQDPQGAMFALASNKKS